MSEKPNETKVLDRRVDMFAPAPMPAVQKRNEYASTTRDILYQVLAINLDAFSATGNRITEVPVSGATFFYIMSTPNNGNASAFMAFNQGDFILLRPGDKYRMPPIEKLRCKRASGGAAGTLMILISNELVFDMVSNAEAGVATNDRGAWNPAQGSI